MPLLPVSLQSFIAHRLTDLCGIWFATTGICLSLILFTFNVNDPSFNTASSGGKIHNAFGGFGSCMADILLQTLGLSSWLFALAFIVWGYRILARKSLGPLDRRIFLLVVAVLAGAVALSRFPSSESWGIGPTLGGSVGAGLFKAISGPLQDWLGGGAFTFVEISTLGIFALSCLLALGVEFREWASGMGRVRGGAAALSAAAANSLERFREWHSLHASVNPALLQKPRIRFLEDAAPGSGTTGAETGGVLSSLSAARRKPVVTPRQEKSGPAGDRKDRQKQLNLRTSDDEWQLPSLDLLEDRANAPGIRLDEASLQKNAGMLQSTLHDFGVEGDILKVSPGPIVTLYEMEPAPGTKTSRVIGLADDIARSMSAVSVRVAVVPGKNAIGMELPNAKRETVFLKEMLASRDYQKTACRLPLALGKNIAGDPVIADLTRMPHLLVAGTTGSGKSVALNTMILSLLYRLSPERCRFIMIDPKMLELSVYDDIPHLLTPVVTESHRTITALKWAVREMEDRYRAMSKLGVRNIDGFNERLRDALAKGEVLMHKIQTGFDSDTGKPIFEEQPISLAELPYIVIIVDEFADLMLVAGKDVENAIQRLAQMARAAGIHLIMATQRPSVDVITGVIKANFPTRISFQVTSKIDSRTILGEGGAEQLLGQGDMLYMAAGGRITRVHGPFVGDGEVEKIVKCLRAQGVPDYIDGVTDDEEEDAGETGDTGGISDDLYDQAVQIVLRERKASTSFIQRHLQIGYNRAARIIDRMEKEGLISAANHVGKREILSENYGT
ncbi:MAG: DNA translocase FtsK 4TM domain-containing protein [Pseudomonadota bacterium]